MLMCSCTAGGRSVALRKESVDRNWERASAATWARRSLSARRAWIEIPAGVISCKTRPVALRKESVDRNIGLGACIVAGPGRSPQGERG